MIWKIFTCICGLFVLVHSKKYDTARDCMAFVPGTSDPNLYRNIDFITVPLKYDNRDINPQYHHIIPAKTLRRFFNTALHSNSHRVPFIKVLELSHFARGRYLQDIPDELDRFINDLEHVRFNVCDSDQWKEKNRQERELITRALDHYGRFVRSMFILMPFNLVKGPEKRCGGPVTELDEQLQHIVGRSHFENLRAIYNAMEKNNLGSAISLLFTMLRNNFRDQPYEYHERNWRYNSEKDCYDVKQNSTHKKGIPEREEETAHGRWEKYGVQFPFSVGGKQYFYAQNTDSRHWFIQELLINGKVGKETASGRWNNVYRVQFSYSVGGKVYFYAQNTDTKYWFIQELLSNGKMGEETANGHWDNVYRIQFPFSFGGKQYFYGQNAKTRFWFIQELLPNGKMGEEITNGVWGHVKFTHDRSEL